MKDDLDVSIQYSVNYGNDNSISSCQCNKCGRKMSITSIEDISIVASNHKCKTSVKSIAYKFFTEKSQKHSYFSYLMTVTALVIFFHLITEDISNVNKILCFVGYIIFIILISLINELINKLINK